MRAFEPVSSPMSVQGRIACHRGSAVGQGSARSIHAKEWVMSSNGTVLSPYDKRVQLVVKTINDNEKLGDKATLKLAVQVLHALDHLPEKVR